MNTQGMTEVTLTHADTREQATYTVADIQCAKMLAAEDHGGDSTDWLTAGELSDRDSDRVYVVRDASGEYIRGQWNDDGDMVPAGRTPASDEACEFSTREKAQAACTRATDSVIETEAN